MFSMEIVKGWRKMSSKKYIVWGAYIEVSWRNTFVKGTIQFK